MIKQSLVCLFFSRTKRGADRLAKVLDKANIPSAAIHGDKSQGARERALAEFKAGKKRVFGSNRYCR